MENDVRSLTLVKVSTSLCTGLWCIDRPQERMLLKVAPGLSALQEVSRAFLEKDPENKTKRRDIGIH